VPPNRRVASLGDQTMPPTIMPPYRRVTSLGDLNRADHISFCCGLYYHHAIVMEATSTKLTIISFTDTSQGSEVSQEAAALFDLISTGLIAALESKRNACVQIQVLTKEVFGKQLVGVYDYNGVCYSDDTVIDRAMNVLNGEVLWDKYDVKSNNCEHFATWCKTGKKISIQVVIAAAASASLASCVVQ